MAKNPRIIVVILNCNNTINDISDKVAKNAAAFLVDIAPLAMGRDFVRSTSLSKSRSHMSFTTQPAPRIIIAPIINSAMVLISNAPLDAKAIPHKAGISKSHMPMGRSSLIR